MPRRRLWLLVFLLVMGLACNLPLTPAVEPPSITAEAPSVAESATTPNTPTPTGPTATPTRVTCDEDVPCLIQASQACQPAEGTYTLQSEVMGAISQIVLQFTIQGPTSQGKCAFEVTPLSVSLEYTDAIRQQLQAQGLSDTEIEAQRQAMEKAARESAPAGTCVGDGADLAALLQRWEEGHYALDDWAAFTCTGTLAQSGDTIILTVEVTVEAPAEVTATTTPPPPASPTVAPGSYPDPQISFLSVESQADVLVYRIRVDNWQAYPEAWFQAAPNLPPCGQNPNAARAWVHIINADTGRQLYGFCAMMSPEDLQSLWFRWPKTQPPPRIIVDIWDRLEDVHYRSEPLAMPAP